MAPNVGVCMRCLHPEKRETAPPLHFSWSLKDPIIIGNTAKTNCVVKTWLPRVRQPCHHCVINALLCLCSGSALTAAADVRPVQLRIAATGAHVRASCRHDCAHGAQPPGCGPVAGPGRGQHAGHAAHRPRMQPVGAFSGMSYSPKRSLQAHSCKLASSVNMKARQSCDRLLYTALAGSLSSAAHRFDL